MRTSRFELCEKLSNALASDTRRRWPALRGALLIGGTSKGEQMRAARGGLHYVVATPGRLNDMLNSKKINLDICTHNDVQMFSLSLSFYEPKFEIGTFLCLDEADRLVDMGFEEDTRNVMNHLKHQRQVCVFSLQQCIFHFR